MKHSITLYPRKRARGKLLSYFVLVCFSLMFTNIAFGQSSGELNGKVIDRQTGEPLAGATLTVEGVAIYGTTNIDGDFTIFSIPEGSNTVTCSFLGIKN